MLAPPEVKSCILLLGIRNTARDHRQVTPAIEEERSLRSLGETPVLQLL
jgi:hypothetical protein